MAHTLLRSPHGKVRMDASGCSGQYFRAAGFNRQALTIGSSEDREFFRYQASRVAELLKIFSKALIGENMADFNFSTRNVEDKQRFDYWREVVCQHCIPADSGSPHRGNFDASIEGRTIGALSIAKMVGPEHYWSRDASYIRTGPESSLWLSYMESGMGCLEQNGRSVVQKSGDIVLYDAARPFKYNIVPESFFILRIPRELLFNRTAAAERLVATSLGEGTGLRPLLGGLIKEASGNAMLSTAPVAGSKLTSSILDLLACMIDLREGNEGSKTVVEALYRRICAYVERSIENPELSVELIAKAERVSPRTVSRVFAVHGTTPMRYIWQKRLEASYRALAQGSVRKVSEAAMNYGFSDLSHFSRTFKKTFGVSPQKVILRH